MASQSRSHAVRQSLHLRIAPSKHTSKALIAQTPTSAATLDLSTDDTSHFASDQVPDTTMFSVLCMYDFIAEEVGLLSFKKGEILDIVKRDVTGWWAAMPQEGTIVGWIPQAFVNPLSEEMAERLRTLGEEFRIPEYEAEQLYSSAPPYESPVDLFGDSANASPTYQDYKSKDVPRYTITQDHNNDHSSVLTDAGSRYYPRPPPSPSSPMPHPPLQVLPAHQATFSTPNQDNESSRMRTGSLSRSLRRRPVMVDDNPTLVQLSTLLESNNSSEINKLGSPDISGSYDAISKRNREEGERRKDMKYTKTISLSSSQYAKPRYLRLLYADQIDEDEKGHIRYASLPALIERLTIDPGLDMMKLAEINIFINTFLMTFRTFITANQLFEFLVERFEMKAPKSLTNTEYKDWKTNFREPVRRRILEVFGRWLEDHRLLEEEPHIAQSLTKFLNTIAPPHDVTASAMLTTVERLTFTIPNRLPTSATPKKARKSKAYKNDLLKLDPVDIAEQLTVLEFSLYVKITPQECLTYARSQIGNNATNLQEFCRTHDKLVSWVKASILNNDVLGKRAGTVEFWIKVAEKCRTLNNFASMSAIIIALSSTVISRLHLTWAHVSRKSNLDTLLRHNEPTGGFAGYRALLQQTEGVCVPFIGMYLTDIVHIHDQFLPEDNRICFYQRARWYEIITNMLRFQARTYNIAISDTTTNFIETRLREGTERDENWFWNKSQEVQHSELAHADIRKGLEAAGF